LTDPTGPLLDRLAIQDLVADYARCVDARDFQRLETLFSRDARFAMHYGDPARIEPALEMRGIPEIMKGMRAGLESYRSTTHFIGNQTVEIDGDQARAETYGLAHHLLERDGRWIDSVLSIRYEDHCVREDGRWRFAERVVAVDWTEERAVQSRS
jgi:hypothetical protein